MSIDDIGNALRKMRKDSGKKLEQIAEETGYSIAHIFKAEYGSYSIGYLVDMLDYYGFEIVFVKKEE